MFGGGGLTVKGGVRLYRGLVSCDTVGACVHVPSAAARSSLEISSSFGSERVTGCFGWNCLSIGFSL